MLPAPDDEQSEDEVDEERAAAQFAERILVLENERISALAVRIEILENNILDQIDTYRKNKTDGNYAHLSFAVELYCRKIHNEAARKIFLLHIASHNQHIKNILKSLVLQDAAFASHLFFNAIYYNDLFFIKLVLETKPELINTPDGFFHTPLSRAIDTALEIAKRNSGESTEEILKVVAHLLKQPGIDIDNELAFYRPIIVLLDRAKEYKGNLSFWNCWSLLFTMLLKRGSGLHSKGVQLNYVEWCYYIPPKEFYDKLNCYHYPQGILFLAKEIEKAQEEKDEPYLQILLQHVANCFVPDKDGRSIFDKASSSSKKDDVAIANFLKKYKPIVAAPREIKDEVPDIEGRQKRKRKHSLTDAALISASNPVYNNDEKRDARSERLLTEDTQKELRSGTTLPEPSP